LNKKLENRAYMVLSIMTFFLPHFAGNALLEAQILKVSWGSMPPDPLESHTTTSNPFTPYFYISVTYFDSY